MKRRMSPHIALRICAGNMQRLHPTLPCLKTPVCGARSPCGVAEERSRVGFDEYQLAVGELCDVVLARRRRLAVVDIRRRYVGAVQLQCAEPALPCLLGGGADSECESTLDLCTVGAVEGGVCSAVEVESDIFGRVYCCRAV